LRERKKRKGKYEKKMRRYHYERQTDKFRNTFTYCALALMRRKRVRIYVPVQQFRSPHLLAVSHGPWLVRTVSNTESSAQEPKIS
jgi:hypothetical protein